MNVISRDVHQGFVAGNLVPRLCYEGWIALPIDSQSRTLSLRSFREGNGGLWDNRSPEADWLFARMECRGKNKIFISVHFYYNLLPFKCVIHSRVCLCVFLYSKYLRDIKTIATTVLLNKALCGKFSEELLVETPKFADSLIFFTSYKRTRHDIVQIQIQIAISL